MDGVPSDRSPLMRCTETPHSGERGAAVPDAASAPDEHGEKLVELLGLLEPGQRLGQMSAFAKSYCDAALCRRLLRKYGGDLRKSSEKLEAALVWRQRHERLLTTLQFEEASDLRVIGSDVAGRPILYQCCRNQMLSNSRGLEQYVVRMTQAVAMMPPGVQTMTHVWDMHGLKLHLNLNPVSVVKLLNALEGYFAGRMHRLLVVDMPRVAVYLKDAVWPAVPEDTRKKVCFFTMAEALAHLRGSCHEPVRCDIQAAMAQNRDRESTLGERRSTWVHVGPGTASAGQ